MGSKVVVILAVAAVSYGVWKKAFPEVPMLSRAAGKLEITKGDIRTELSTKSRKKMTGEYLVIGAQLANAPFATAVMSVLPMKVVPRLERKYKNFLHCKNDNSFVGLDHVVDLTLLITDKDMEARFKRVMDLMIDKDYRPVIKLSADGFSIQQVTKDGAPVTLSGISQIHTIDSLNVSREDYRTRGFENDRSYRIFRVMR